MNHTVTGDAADASDIAVALDSINDEWDEVEIRLDPAALAVSAKRDAPPPNSNIELTNLPSTSVKFDECWQYLKSKDLSEEKNRVVQQQREIDQQRASKSCFKRGCWPRLCRVCNAKLSDELENEKQIVLALTKVPFNDNDPMHLRMLTSLYKSCSLSTANAPKRYGAHWEYIGFQGTDPATDLRGAGIFGLLQLVAFATDANNQQQIKALMDLSQDTVQNFPLAIVGINITKSVLTSLRKGNLNRLCKKEKSIIRVLNALYKGGLCMFYNAWLHGRKTIEASGLVLRKIDQTASKHPKKLTRTKMDLTKWIRDSKKEQQETALNFHSI